MMCGEKIGLWKKGKDAYIYDRGRNIYFSLPGTKQFQIKGIWVNLWNLLLKKKTLKIYKYTTLCMYKENFIE